MDVKGKAALVTGAASGIGQATALRLGAAGCSVAVNYSQSVEPAEATVAQLIELGVNAVAVQGNVADDGDCRRVVDETVKAFGRLDVLVNSAGTTVFVDHSDLEGVGLEDWEHLFAVNTIGPFQMMRAAAEHLRADGGGDVVNISSVAGVAGIGSSIPYCASKAALNSLTLTMARVLAPEVRVNAVAPGFVTGRWFKEKQSVEVHDRLVAALEESTPLKAVCTPDDVARTVMSFITANDLATAQIQVLDGGMLIKI